jgi:hypothetical protein
MTVFPPKSCINFAGNRVDAYRAGMTAIIFIVLFFAAKALVYEVFLI